jgi:hypothetical protein
MTERNQHIIINGATGRRFRVHDADLAAHGALTDEQRIAYEGTSESEEIDHMDRTVKAGSLYSPDPTLKQTLATPAQSIGG